MILRIALALIIFSLPAAALAQDPPELIGTVVELEGTAQKAATTEEQPKPLGVDHPVYLNDTIETGPGSKALIVFIDDTQITLGENASLSVDEYIFDPASNVESYANFKPLKGAFLFVSGWITKAQRPEVNIEVPAGSLGIRGTIVWGGRLDDDYGVFVQEGEVNVRNNTGSVLVRSGEGTNLLTRDVRPTDIKAWGQEKITRAVGTITLKDMVRAKQRVDAQKQANLQLRRTHADRLEKIRAERRKLIEGQREDNREVLEEKIEQRKEKLEDRELPTKIIEQERPREIEQPRSGESFEQKRNRREQRSRQWIKNRQSD